MQQKTLSALVQSFFTVALPQQGMSPLTILSYRDAFKLLLRFVVARTRRPVVRLDVKDIDVAAVRDFFNTSEHTLETRTVHRTTPSPPFRSFFASPVPKDPPSAVHRSAS